MLLYVLCFTIMSPLVAQHCRVVPAAYQGGQHIFLQNKKGDTQGVFFAPYTAEEAKKICIFVPEQYKENIKDIAYGVAYFYQTIGRVGILDTRIFEDIVKSRYGANPTLKYYRRTFKEHISPEAPEAIEICVTTLKSQTHYSCRIPKLFKSSVAIGASCGDTESPCTCSKMNEGFCACTELSLCDCRNRKSTTRQEKIKVQIKQRLLLPLRSYYKHNASYQQEVRNALKYLLTPVPKNCSTRNFV